MLSARGRRPVDETSSPPARGSSDVCYAPATLAARAYLIAIDGGWALWSEVCLRGAGFPARSVRRLSAPDAARAADDARALEEESRRLQAAALECAEAARRSAGDDARAALARLVKAIRRGEDAP